MHLELIELKDLVWIFLPLLALQLSLVIISFWDWNKKRHTLGQNKILWLLIILIFSIVGPIIYLAYSQQLTTNITSPDNEENDDWGV